MSGFGAPGAALWGQEAECEGWSPSLCTAPALGGESRLDVLLQDCAARAQGEVGLGEWVNVLPGAGTGL